MEKDMLEWYQLLYVSQSSALQESSDEYRGSWTLHSMTLPTNTPISPHTLLSSGSEDVISTVAKMQLLSVQTIEDEKITKVRT